MLDNYLRVLPQYLVPQHALSRLVGYFTRCQKPWFKDGLIKQFIAHYAVDMSTALEPDPYQYPSFNAFFTRKLRPDARPICAGVDSIACPVDGCISQLGKIDQGRIIQAKGFHYDVQQLLGGSEARAAPFSGGTFATIYLAPKDYHRVHLPIDATLVEMVYVPGQLFSVNPLTADTVPHLFARNERVAMLFDTAAGPMAIVMVGAMLVASINIAWEGDITPPQSKTIKTWDYKQQPKHMMKGEELGYFELGSTVIVLFGAERMRWLETLAPEQTVRFGQLMGHQSFSSES